MPSQNLSSNNNTVQVSNNNVSIPVISTAQVSNNPVLSPTHASGASNLNYMRMQQSMIDQQQSTIQSLTTQMQHMKNDFQKLLDAQVNETNRLKSDHVTTFDSFRKQAEELNASLTSLSKQCQQEAKSRESVSAQLKQALDRNHELEEERKSLNAKIDSLLTHVSQLERAYEQITNHVDSQNKIIAVLLVLTVCVIC